MSEPYTTKRISVAIGQRFDLEVTYDEPGVAKLLSYVEAQDDAGKVSKVAFPAFTVDVAPSARVPREIVWPSVSMPDRAPSISATLKLSATREGSMPWTLNGKADPTAPLYTWPQGSTVDLVIDNDIETEHPFHLHGQFFEIVEPKNQPGLKDVVLVPPAGKVRIRAYVDNPGRWMSHCHILEHAEMGMMGEIVVTPDPDAPAIVPASR